MQKLLLPLLLILTACTPKYGYKSPTVADHSTEQMIVVMDYLAFVDDVGKLYNYDIAYNHKQLDTLKQRVAEVLHQKGYEDIVFAMLSSGIDLNRQMDFELYENKKNQEKLITHPSSSKRRHSTKQPSTNYWPDLLRHSVMPVLKTTNKTNRS